MQGCTITSTYSGLIFGGQDLANTTKQNFDGVAGSILAIPAFICGTVTGPIIGMFWGICGDIYILRNIDSLVSPHPHLAIHNDSFILAERPFTGVSKIENRNK